MIRRSDVLFDHRSLTERGLILLSGFFNNVVTKLGFYRLANTSMTHAFDRFFKWFDHFAWTKPPKITTLGFAWTGREFFRQVSKFSSAFQTFSQFDGKPQSLCSTIILAFSGASIHDYTFIAHSIFQPDARSYILISGGGNANPAEIGRGNTFNNL